MSTEGSQGAPARQMELVEEFSAVLDELEDERRRFSVSAESAKRLGQLAEPVRRVSARLGRMNRPEALGERDWRQLEEHLRAADRILRQAVRAPLTARRTPGGLDERARELDRTAANILQYADLSRQVAARLGDLRQRFALLVLPPSRVSAANFLEFPVTMHCEACGWERHSSRGDRKNSGHQVREHVRSAHPDALAGPRSDALDRIWRRGEDEAYLGPVRIYRDPGRLPSGAAQPRPPRAGRKRGETPGQPDLRIVHKDAG